MLLKPYRVIDLTQERGMLAGQILADLGADVIQVEPPGGASGRRLGPFYQDINDGEHSLFWWGYSRGKRSIELDLDADRLLDVFRALTGIDDRDLDHVETETGKGLPAHRHQVEQSGSDDQEHQEIPVDRIADEAFEQRSVPLEAGALDDGAEGVVDRDTRPGRNDLDLDRRNVSREFLG